MHKRTGKVYHRRSLIQPADQGYASTSKSPTACPQCFLAAQIPSTGCPGCRRDYLPLQNSSLAARSAGYRPAVSSSGAAMIRSVTEQRRRQGVETHLETDHAAGNSERTVPIPELHSRKPFG